MKPLKFFTDRIGKIIYRDNSGCNCWTCQEVVKNGIRITDEKHAEYLHCTQNEFAEEGVYLNYRDKKYESKPTPLQKKQ